MLGATGGTGSELVRQALEQRHELTLLVRDRGRLPADFGRLRTVVGSATDPQPLDEAVAGQDAVLCALGTRSPFGTDLMRASVRALVPAMERHGVRRLILLSALGVGESYAHAPLLFRVAFRTLLAQVGRDKALAERELRASALDWTIVYPPALTRGPRTERYRAGETLELSSRAKVSRADVAHFMLTQLADDRFRRKAAVVSG